MQLSFEFLSLAFEFEIPSVPSLQKSGFLAVAVLPIDTAIVREKARLSGNFPQTLIQFICD
jgi:hypothetical protein